MFSVTALGRYECKHMQLIYVGCVWWHLTCKRNIPTNLVHGLGFVSLVHGLGPISYPTRNSCTKKEQQIRCRCHCFRPVRVSACGVVVAASPMLALCRVHVRMISRSIFAHGVPTPSYVQLVLKQDRAHVSPREMI